MLLQFLPLVLTTLFGSLALARQDFEASSTTRNEFISKTLASNMVLQRDTSTNIHGYSKLPSNKITVTIDGNQYTNFSSDRKSKQGGYFWIVELPPRTGGFLEYTIQAQSASGENATLQNIVFGDVFLCSGQSNMQLGLAVDLNASAEIADADNYPFIRLFAVGMDNSMPSTIHPLDDLYSVEKSWMQASSTNVNGGNWDYFSAVCYLTGKNIYKESLQSKVPVGLISSMWGGTYIEAWNPAEVKSTCNGTLGDEYEPKSPQSNINPNQVSILYNNMIYPFKNTKLSGVIWYQGESNVNEPSQYSCMLNEMVKLWRSSFQTSFPFIYVQLSTWANGGTSAISNFRNMQFDFLKSSGNKVTMITAADLGDPESEFGDIHPRKKSEVGRRLGLAAANLIYNISQPHLGPLIDRFELFDDTVLGWSVRLHFTPDSSANSIQLQAPQECPDPAVCAYPLLIYDNDKIVSTQVSVSSATSVDIKPTVNQGSASRPVKFSYCQGDYPMMTIYNGAGIPLLPYLWHF